MLGDLLATVRAARSRALVLRGEPGSGKTALLGYLATLTAEAGGRVIGVAGVEAERHAVFGGLHQLCQPMLDGLDALPAAQRAALRVTFGLAEGPAPDRFLVGLAVLSLLAETAAERPLICLADDVQWLDTASVQVLGFVAGRLDAEAVGLVLATRRADDLTGLPELVLGGLPEKEARELLDSALTAPLDPLVRDQIVAEAHGNPLALLELPRTRSAAELAGGFGLPGEIPGRVEEGFRRRFAALPADSRVLSLLAAADPSGDPVLVWRAAARLGVGAAAARPPAAAGLIEFGERILFRHPLARSAAYRAATDDDRRAAHAALAQATDPVADPDRRAWHRAQAADGPDEEVAAELERSAERAEARGGVAAAAAFLERAAQLTPDPAARVSRSIAAAGDKVQAGAPGEALALLADAAAGPLDARQDARLHLVRAQLAFAADRGSEAPPLLLAAARRLESVDPALSRSTYLDALLAAGFAGRLATPESTIRVVARAAGQAPPPSGPPRVSDQLLAAVAALYNDGYEPALPLMRRALATLDDYAPDRHELRWLSHAWGLANYLWNDDQCARVADRYLELTRQAGALADLPLALIAALQLRVFGGELDAAAELAEELRTVTEVTGARLVPYGLLQLTAVRGREAETLPLIEYALRTAEERGEGFGVSAAEYASALLNNGLGRFPEALGAARRATEGAFEMGFSTRALIEVVEAAVRAGRPAEAIPAHARLARMTRAAGTDWALGLGARADALMAEEAEAEDHYRAAVERLGRTRIHVELARTHLLHGEWLLSRGRPAEARIPLRTARGQLERMGVEGFAARARRALRATGDTVRTRPAHAPVSVLTRQEAKIAGLARDGLSNPEIGARLFLSGRTVQYHLTKVFAKLGIRSRLQLHRALEARATTPGPAVAPPDREPATPTVVPRRTVAATEPDEKIAAELAEAAERALRRGDLPTAAALLERATLLTPDLPRQAARAFHAAEAKYQVGEREAAAELLAVAEAAPADELTQARIMVLRGQLVLVSGDSSGAPARLLDAARQFSAIDPEAARDTYLEALAAATYVARLASPAGLLEVARAVPAPPPEPRPADLLLAGLTTLISSGYRAGVPRVRRALAAWAADDLPAAERIRWSITATRLAVDVWDDESWRDQTRRHAWLARKTGALAVLPMLLLQRTGFLLHAGEFTEAEATVAEAGTFGTALPAFGPMQLAAWRGQPGAVPLIEGVTRDVTARGYGMGVTLAHYTAAVLGNALGRYDDALASARLATAYPSELGFANLALPELIEAAVRAGRQDLAESAVERLARTTGPARTAWAEGIEARSRALLAERPAAEKLFVRAVDRLSAAPARAELARAHLLFGEWLRRERRRADARDHLRIAYDLLSAIGMAGFAERARRELLATGGRARPGSTTAGPLTAQEEQVARLARDGLSNPEIAVRLYLSARTVQHHLSRVFAKLGINSRAELHRVLPRDQP